MPGEKPQKAVMGGELTAMSRAMRVRVLFGHPFKAALKGIHLFGLLLATYPCQPMSNPTQNVYFPETDKEKRARLLPSPAGRSILDGGYLNALLPANN